MVQAKMNSHLNLHIYSLICMPNIKDENIINNQLLPRAAYSHKPKKMMMNNNLTIGGLSSRSKDRGM